MTINIGRATSGGVLNGVFGNPVRELIVDKERYRKHFKKVIRFCPTQVKWLKEQIDNGAILFCPGCGINSPTCHARVIEEELKNL
jgi:Pyruvate/2-oxoacid:ferredoxin oxidoreductase delta subunit